MIFYLALVDGEGVYGTFLTYGMTTAFVGSAFLAFLYLWQKERLDMDEEPKLQMMQTNEDEEHDNTRR